MLSERQEENEEDFVCKHSQELHFLQLNILYV